jgi:16S rRNA (cytosine967-C5)-methyltransferase
LRTSPIYPSFALKLVPRLLALDVLDSVLARHASFDDSFDKHPRTQILSTRDRAFAFTLVATTLRHLGEIDAAIAACLRKPMPHKAVRALNLLRLGAAQLLFLGTPAHAAVDTAVRLASKGELVHYKNLANAVLHRIAREGAELIAGLDAARINTPDWLWQSWATAYGDAEARAIAIAHLSPAPLDLAVKSNPEGWAAKLGAELLPGGALRLIDAAPVPSLPGYAEGAWWVQDAAAQMPARLLGDVRGKKIADLGAAPGGKTAQLAAAGAEVIAVDRSAGRLELVQENLSRLGLTAELVEADARNWRPKELLDAVLLDAPCSATGTIRRHPDIPHLRRPGDVAKSTVLQVELLRAAQQMVKPGGTVVYAVCSLQPEEGAPILAACDSHAEEEIRTLPSQGIDGFYAARMTVTNR